MGKRLRQLSLRRTIDQLTGGPRETRTGACTRWATADPAPSGARSRLLEMSRQGVQVFAAHGGRGDADDGRVRHIALVPPPDVVTDRVVAYCAAVLSVEGMRIPGPGPLCSSCLEQVRL